MSNQALMEQWRAELARKPLAMSEAEACAALGISHDAAAGGVVAEEDMRRAYRSLARKYHPDKNPSPEARAKFLAVQKAYERLQAGAAGGQGPQAWRVQLMLRAQCILYGRYPEVLEPFKYAGYPLLLEVLRQQGSGDLAAGGGGGGGGGVDGMAGAEKQQPAGAAADKGGDLAASGGAAAGGGGGGGGAEAAHFLHGERVGLVQAAVELCWLTCVASSLNAEELLRCGGCSVLSHLLSRCVGIMPADVAPTAPEAVITTHALRTLAGLAAVPAARREMEAPRYGQLLADVVRCCGLERAHAAVEAALMVVAQLAASPELQVGWVGCVFLRTGAPLVSINLLHSSFATAQCPPCFHCAKTKHPPSRCRWSRPAP
jgi:DnaJ family protein C protein 13